MPGNGVGDRVHNFFAQENLSQGQHSHAVGGNSPSDNNLWVSNQKQIGSPSLHTKAYDPEQSEVEPRHDGLRVPVSNGLNFMQATARAEFTKNQSQSRHQIMNRYMYGHDVLQPRPNEAVLLGLDRDSTQDNVNTRGFLVHELQQGGVFEQISNSNRSNEIDAHGSLNLFGGQHQTNSQHPGLLQRVQQQQSGFSGIALQRQLMLRKMQELQRQKDMRQLNTRQHSSLNQASSFARQASGSHPHGLVNGTPTSDSSGYAWNELAAGNTNWLQRASPAMQGSSSGLAFSPEQGQPQRSMGFVQQQVDQSLYGVPVSSSRGLLNSYPYASTDEVSTQQMPTSGNSFPGNHNAGIREQVISHDGTLVSRQGVPGKSLFGHMSGQGSNSWIKMEQIQQFTSTNQTGSEQEFQGPLDLIGPSQMAQDEPAIEASHMEASLDPEEEKILFGSDENIWDAFGSDRNMGGGASSLLYDNNEFASGLPSIQSGSWSALMQSAVAEASGTGIGLQEKWTPLNFQNLEHPSARHPSTYEGSGKQTPLADVNLSNASAMSFGVGGATMKDKHQRNAGIQHDDKQSPYENDVRPLSNSSERMNQYSSGGSKWLNGGPLQKVDAGGSQLYGSSLPHNKENDWTPTESTSNPGDRAFNTIENGYSMQQSQRNNHTRVMQEEIGQGDGIWRVNALPNSIVDPESTNTSMGSPQISGEGFTVNNAVATPNLSNMQGASHFGQFPINSHQLSYWKRVESSVRSKGTGNLRKPQGRLNKGSQVSESSFNSSDKEDLKMHEIESRSKRENSNDSYQSSSSCQVTTARLRENSSSDAGDFRALPATKQHSSNQSGRMTSGQRKFQYHPMGNLDEEVKMPYGKLQSTNTQASSLQNFRRLRGQGQGNVGHINISGQGHVSDLEGITKGSHGIRSKNMIGGHDIFASFDRSVGLSTSEKDSQSSQNMLELFHKVDQSRYLGNARHLNSSEHDLSSEMHVPDCSDGSLGGLQRSQSSNSQGFSLQLGPPSLRSPLPDNTSKFLRQPEAFCNLRDRGQALLPSFQETPHGGFKNNRIDSSEQNTTEISLHKMTANLSSSLGAVFPVSRSQLQNHQMVSARGLALTNNPDNESLNTLTDETCNGPHTGQSAEGCMSNKASFGQYTDAASSHRRVKASQISGGEKLLATLPQTSSSMSEHCRSSKMLLNESTDLSSQQQDFTTQTCGVQLNLCKSSQLNIVESTSIGLQNLEDHEAEKRGNLFPTFCTSSLNSQGLASAGVRSTKDSFSSQNVLCGEVDGAQTMNGSQKEFHANPATSEIDLEAFGHSLKPKHFYQNNSLMNQMRATRNMDNDPCIRVTKRMKVSDNVLDGKQVAPSSGQPNGHNDMVGDALTCSTTVLPGDSQMLNFSGSGDNVLRNVPSQPGYVPSVDVLASCQNESQSSVPSNSMTPVKAEHSHISPQMAPSWFDRYGTFKNGQSLPERVGTVKSIEQPFSVQRLSGGLETHNTKGQASSAVDTSQIGAIWKNPAPPSVALEQSSSLLPRNAGIQHLITLRPKKRRLTAAGLHPWFLEVSASFKNLQGICTGAVEWCRATNRPMEKVDDDGDVIEDVLPVTRSKRRLIFTSLLMQQLLHPPPEAILSIDARSIYESVVYYMARLALGDACNLVSFARSYSSIFVSGANCLSDQCEEPERIDDHCLSKVIEDFMSKAQKLEDDFSRLDKIASVVDLKVEFGDLERFSVVNHFARFHGRMQADGAETSSIISPRRYVTAVAFPAILPDAVQCLSL
ncbi:uncharacterized protein LOC112511185 isoform X3 [Cynara cardunculus var. scolymus]|uniref:uncharacterized protein LOC112511185 isoform X3 n=1 Tax=Cynara cardunculus var. scolymus TaxID=59895 RepID=UPI000D62BEE5|nr:uncharacterized protein LOC112511185 isoform X3 [Cynara cardunculus var. scolymus]